MAIYPRLHSLIQVRPGQTPKPFAQDVVPYLVNVWLDEYDRTSDIPWKSVQVTLDSFSYLFDTEAMRLIAAWGISQGKNTAPRDSNRMKGHPLGNGPLYHRGHAIAHQLHGGTDINIVPQLGKVNNGAFKILENRAAGTPGALYFTFWTYLGAAAVIDKQTQKMHPGQTPTWVEQGLLILGKAPEITQHSN